MYAYLVINDWAGRHENLVDIIGETPKKYRVILMVDTKLAGKNKYGKKGEVILVPKTAIKIN